MERSNIVAKGTNKALLLGHVGKDPEIRSTAGGTTVATFSLATADRQKDGQGNWTDKTEWHNLVALSRTAEVVRDYVKKGTQLFIEGKIQTRSWDDKSTGEKKYRTEILIDELTLLGGRSGGENGSSSYGSGRAYSRGSAGSFAQSQSTSGDHYGDQGISDDDIPF
jgi:single-strand DNA-binding protein